MWVLPWSTNQVARDAFHRTFSALPTSAAWHNRSRVEHSLVSAALLGPQLRVFLGPSDGWSRAITLVAPPPLNPSTPSNHTSSCPLPSRLEAAGYEHDLLQLFSPCGQPPDPSTAPSPVRTALDSPRSPSNTSRGYGP